MSGRPPRSEALWSLQFTRAQVDRRTPRTGVDPGVLSDLVGADGNYEGGVRPHSGFRMVQELGFLDEPNHNGRSVVLDAYPVAISWGVSEYAYGHVYRVRRGGFSTSDIYAELWNSEDASFSLYTLIEDVEAGTGTGAGAKEADLDSPMNVSTFGRFIYVSVRGNPMIVVYWDEDASSIRVLGDDDLSGPGLRPVGIGPEQDNFSSGFIDPPSGTRPAVIQWNILSSVDIPAQFDGGVADPVGSTDAGDYPQGELGTTEIEPGRYTFGCVLMDSTTGRRTSLSDIGSVSPDSFPESNGENVSGTPYAQIVYDSDKFDQAWMYRSVKTEDAGGSFSARILQLDAIIDLADYKDANQEDAAQSGTALSSPWVRARFYYSKSDTVLGFQETYNDFAFFETTPPKAGVSGVHRGALFLSDIRGVNTSEEDPDTPGPEARNVSEIRHSSLSSGNLELFSPSDRFTTGNPSNTVIAMRNASSNLLGFSRDRIYHVRTEGLVIRIQEMHEGFGVAGRHTLATVGSRVYFLTERGLKSVSSNGQLDTVSGLNYDIVQRWKGDLPGCSMAYDSSTGALHILNPVKEEMISVWFNSGVITRDVDVPFDFVREGPWPIGTVVDNEMVKTDADSDLSNRALFYLNNPDITQDVASWTPSVSVLDFGRDKKREPGVPGGGDRISLLGVDRTSLLITTNGDESGDEIPVIGWSPGNAREYGAYLYCVESPDPSFVGKKAKILPRESLTPLSIGIETNSGLAGLPSGSVLMLSPVVVRVSTSRLLPHSAEGQPFSVVMNQLAQLESGDAVFTDASGDGLPYTAPFTKMFLNDQTEPVSMSRAEQPIAEGALQGGFTLSDAVRGRRASVAGVNPALELEILAGDADFVFLGMSLYGTMHARTR